MRITLRKLSLTLAVGLFAAAFQPGESHAQLPYSAAEWEQVVSSARKEGRVMVYFSGAVATIQRLVDGFRKRYPDIAPEFQRASTGQALPKLEQERLNNLDGADLWISSEMLWFLARAKDGKLLKPAGPALKEWPAQAVRDGAIVLPGLETFIIIYNKAAIANAPQGYADLLRPEFRGKVGTTDIVATSVIAWYDWLEKTYGPGYLTKLRAQNPRLFSGSVPIAQSVASGEMSIGAFALMGDTKALLAQGAPLGFLLPKPGLASQNAMAALGWSKRPNAALVFVDYIMSRDGQTVWHGAGDSASPLKGIPGALQSEGITPWDATAYPPEVVAALRERWNKIFK